MAKINTNSNVYTIVYAAVLVIIVAFLLALANAALKPRQDANVALSQKKQILASINERNLGDQKSEETYEAIVSDANLDDLKFYIAKKDGEKYILPVRGAGLWGGIWGYVALDDDCETVYGTYFSHESETAGLGARITESEFQNTFQGKKLYAGDDKSKVALSVVKKGKEGDLSADNYVNGITGATLTSDGVNNMIQQSLSAYSDILESLKK